MFPRLPKEILLTLLLASGLTACIPNLANIDNQNASDSLRKDMGQTVTPTTEQSSKATSWLTIGIFSEFRSSGNLWDRLQANFKLPHYSDSPQVQAQIAWFMRHQEYLNRTIRRSAPYMYYIYQQIQRRNLPAELVLLPVIESAYNPFGYSSMGASGLWQMMPQTASNWGIKQNWWYDGRRDIFASTNAALDYLTYLQNYFNGNWLLAIAAYNTGEGNVQAAIRRNSRLGLNTEFWALPLSRETQAYVPRLLALATIISHRETYAVNLPLINDKPYLAQIDVGSQIDLSHAARLAGMSLRELYQLNPGYNHSATEPNGPFILILPIDKIDAFKINLAKYPREERLTWQRYKVHRGDTLPRIAIRFESTIESIRKANKLSANRVKVGKTIIIPITTIAVSHKIAPQVTSKLAAIEKQEQTVSSNTIQQASLATLGTNEEIIAMEEQPAIKTTTKKISHKVKVTLKTKSSQKTRTTYQVRAGDTLSAIAKRFAVKTDDLQQWNKMHNTTNLKPGQKLVIAQS